MQKTKKANDTFELSGSILFVSMKLEFREFDVLPGEP